MRYSGNEAYITESPRMVKKGSSNDEDVHIIHSVQTQDKYRKFKKECTQEKGLQLRI